MTPQQEKKLDSISAWMKGNLPKFDWLLKQKDDLKFYKHSHAQLSVKLEELERRIQALEGDK